MMQQRAYRSCAFEDSCRNLRHQSSNNDLSQAQVCSMIKVNYQLPLQIEGASRLALGAFHYSRPSIIVTNWLMQIAARRSLVVAPVGDGELLGVVLLRSR